MRYCSWCEGKRLPGEMGSSGEVLRVRLEISRYEDMNDIHLKRYVGEPPRTEQLRELDKISLDLGES